MPRSPIELRYCHNCHNPFRGDVRQKYCGGVCKSNAYRERKEKMILALTAYIRGLGYITFTSEHAFRVIESYHTDVKRYMEIFGFSYDNFNHVWIKV